MNKVGEVAIPSYPANLNFNNQDASPIMNSGAVVNNLSNSILSSEKEENNQETVTTDFLTRVEMLRQKAQSEVSTDKNQVYLGSDFRYIGKMQGNKFHGVGTICWQNGDIYSGDFDQGERTGFGCFKSKGIEQVGYFLNGEFKGQNLL